MRVGPFHLTYCSNIHAGESWPEVARALAAVVPDVRRHLGADGPFAIGLRLSAEAAEGLASGGALDDFAAFLNDGGFYVPTINGFPYGAFHRTRVKAHVYLPDWRDPLRLAYTNRLSDLLARLLPEGLRGSVSTVPGGFKPHLNGAGDVARIGAALRSHAAHLRALRDRTGRTVRLALEPEPACLLETVDETIAFFDAELNDATAREFIGVCVDTCHMAVEFEPAADVFARLHAAGIAIPKVQVSSALDASTAEARQALSGFAEDTYLHQVVAHRDGALERFVDLPDALAAPPPDRCRVHFHVPLFLEELGALRSTQPFVRDSLRALVADPVCDQLEVETYTWDVLPAAYRQVDVATAIARELAWVREQLA